MREFEGLPLEKRGKALERAERKFDLQGSGFRSLFVLARARQPNDQRHRPSGRGISLLLGERAAKPGFYARRLQAAAANRQIFDYRDAWEVVAPLRTRQRRHRARLISHSVARHRPPSRSAAFRRTASSWCRSPTRETGDGLPVVEPALAMSARQRGFRPHAAFMDALVATSYDGYLAQDIQ